MLIKVNTFFAFHIQAATHSLNLLCRRPLAALMTMLVIGISLALPSLFWVFTDNFSQLTGGSQRGGHISLYLKPALNDASQMVLMKKVRETQGVGQAVLKSSEEGLAELTHQEGMQDIMRYLPENPLPSVIEVIPALIVDTPDKLDALARQLQAIPDVDQAKMDIEWITRLHVISNIAARAAHALMALLALAVILIIATTLRLTIHHRHEEIQILKLTGAPDPFILRPFLYSGIWYGLAGAILAVFMVNVFVSGIGQLVNQVAAVYQMHYPLTGMSIRQILLLVSFAVILGWIAARLSVKRQLASITPI